MSELEKVCERIRSEMERQYESIVELQSFLIAVSDVKAWILGFKNVKEVEVGYLSLLERSLSLIIDLGDLKTLELMVETVKGHIPEDFNLEWRADVREGGIRLIVNISPKVEVPKEDKK